MKRRTYKKLLLICTGIMLAISTMSTGQATNPFSQNTSILGKKMEDGQNRINMDITNMDVASFLKIISDTSGWTIIPSKDVTAGRSGAKVNLYSKGATARELLDKFALVYDFVCEQEGNLTYIMTRDEYEQRFGQTSKTFALRFQKAESIQALIKSSLTKAGNLAVDAWSNTIVVNDTRENLQKIDSLIARLDQGFTQKRFQLVHARAAEVARILTGLCPKEGPFEADMRTNSILVFNSQSNVQRIAEIIGELDQDMVTRVFPIRFQKASDLAQQLSQLLGSTRGVQNSEKITAQQSRNQIMVSETTNQLIVTGSASQVDYIAGILQEMDSKVITRTIPLKRLKAAEVVARISHLASRPESIAADAQGNQLVIQDNTYNIEQIEQVLYDLDEALETKVITLEYAIAEDILNALASLVSSPNSLQVDQRTNQVIINDSASQIKRLETLIQQLDREDAYFTRTYHLQHASASKVALVIDAFIGHQRPQQVSAGRTSDEQASTDAGLAVPASTTQTPVKREIPGSAPGLAGTITAKTAPPVSTVSQAGPTSGRGSSQETQATESLGAAGTVVPDDRSNTVTVTETLAILSKLEQLIKELDVAPSSYSYVFQNRAIDTVDLQSVLTGVLRPEEDTLVVDSASHSVHFTSIPANADQVLETFRKLDQSIKQVLIRAKIMAVSTSTMKDLGINYNSIIESQETSLILDQILPSQVGNTGGALTFNKLTDTQFEAIIRAIETDNQSELLADPRILAYDNQPAEVRMASDEPFTETSIDSQSGRVIENIRFLQVGTVLQVTPKIRMDRSIEMDLSLDVSSLTDIRNGVPVVNRNIATSTVVVKNDHILMIGGLRFKRDVNTVGKVPLLGDIPVLGKAFQSKRTEKTDTELLLFIQPSIASVGEPIVDPNAVDEYINSKVSQGNVHQPDRIHEAATSQYSLSYRRYYRSLAP